MRTPNELDQDDQVEQEQIDEVEVEPEVADDDGGEDDEAIEEIEQEIP